MNPFPWKNRFWSSMPGTGAFWMILKSHQFTDYEKKLYEYFENEHPGILKEIAEKKEINAELDEAINQALNDFNRKFKEEVAK